MTGVDDSRDAPLTPDGAGPEPERGPEFTGESTDEYRLDEAWTKSSARARVSSDDDFAVEDTREVALPEEVRRSRRPGASNEQLRAQWEARPRIASRLRRWFYSDPLVLWYLQLPRGRRLLLGLATWILLTATTITAFFVASTLSIYPAIEGWLQPLVAPKPESAVRGHPREGYAFDLVEERYLSAEDFRLATDCIWLTPDRKLGWPVERHGLELVQDGQPIASLDLRFNWDGLLRVYFGAGKLPAGEELFIRIPLVGGGLWPLEQHSRYSTYALGGRMPPTCRVGPVRFIE